MYKFLSRLSQRSELSDLCVFCVSELGIPEDELMQMGISHILYILQMRSMINQNKYVPFKGIGKKHPTKDELKDKIFRLMLPK